MQFGLAAWGMRELSLEKQLHLTRELGLDLLEFSIANYPKDHLQIGATADEIAAVRNLYDASGVRLLCGCTGNDFSANDLPEQIAKVKKVISIAGALGIKYLRIFAGFASDSTVHGDKFKRMLDALNCVNDDARQYGLTLCVETHGGVKVLPDGTLMHYNTVSTRCDQLKHILSTGVSICYDPANLDAAGTVSPEEFYDVFKQNIPYIHLKDFRETGMGIVPAACGEGRLNWNNLMKKLEFYSGPAMIEYELPEDVSDGMTRSLNFIKQLI